MREDGRDGRDGPDGPAEDTDTDPGSTHVAKAERTLETRERILSAACEVIAEVGFEKIRMRMVAEHAGASTGLAAAAGTVGAGPARRDRPAPGRRPVRPAALVDRPGHPAGHRVGRVHRLRCGAASTLLLALSDGFGIRLMLGDPRVDLPAAQAAIWRAVAGTLGVPDAFPEIWPPADVPPAALTRGPKGP
ncbi:TetR/AcrR family transcriptional regulator [Streptomyces lydicus]